MFKKIGLFLKFLIVGVLWSTLWCVITQQIVFKIWNFDYLSPNQWRVIKAFWEKNGVIRGVSDYMLFLTLIVILVVWYFGFKKLYHVQYGKFLLKPFESFSKRQITKYENESKHVVIKNLVVGEKMSLEDLIQQKIDAEQSANAGPKESEVLRQNISKKITEQKGK